MRNGEQGAAAGTAGQTQRGEHSGGRQSGCVRAAPHAVALSRWVRPQLDQRLTPHQVCLVGCCGGSSRTHAPHSARALKTDCATPCQRPLLPLAAPRCAVSGPASASAFPPSRLALPLTVSKAAAHSLQRFDASPGTPPAPWRSCLAIMSGGYVWRFCLTWTVSRCPLNAATWSGCSPPGTQSQRTDARETPRVVC